ncbi:MAG TPA: hypothetical protein VI168_05025, partial [Croceibacterium sp.]
MNRTNFRRSSARRSLQALLLSASAIALVSPAMAAEVVFASDSGYEIEPGRRVSQTSGVTQVQLDSGAVLSFVDAADYRLNADGSVDLYAGSVTVAGAAGAVTVIRMPEGVEGRVGGGSAASFSVSEEGTSRGHTLTGEVTIVRAGNTRTFEVGEMWASNDDGLRQVVSNGVQQAPGTEGADEPQVAAMEQGGPVAAAANGIPVSLPDALAFAGASSDIVLAARNVQSAVENPAIDAFPTGDLALLVSYAAQLESPYGGQAFPSARADIIRAYLGHLANGGTGANFLSAYATFLTQYLDLIRAGALPTSFPGASQADINAFIAFTGRTSGFGALSAQNRALVEAYLQFLSSGGNPDLFTRSYTDLVGAYFAYLRTGGDPVAFQGASQQTLAAYIGFLSQSGLAGRLSTADRALLEAYLANGGLAFTSQYRTALDAYFAYLQAGNLPSGYTGLNAATVRSYLEALQRTGLFDQVLGTQAQFYTAFLAHLQGGGAPDAFVGLNANIFSGYGTQLAAYYEFLLQGGQPTGYTALTQQQIAAYLSALQAAGASGVFLDDLAEFYSGYLAYLSGGGNPDLYTGLPSLNLPGFADALNAYAAFLAGGGLPSGYAAVDRATLAQYLDALARSGQLAGLLGDNADLIQAYFAYLANGGATDRYAGLPVYTNYVGALQAYYAFLDAGGLPSAYTALTPAQIQGYLAALASAGGISAQLGSLANFFTGYYAFIAGGGNPANFAGLPLYADYTAALQAYYAFLQGGGLPADYTALTPAQIQAYLAALSAAGGLSTQLGNLSSFYASYYAFIAGGGNPANFAGLPVYANWLAALEAYYAYLGGGGLPSGYTLLTQAQIRAYIEALNGAGVLASELTIEARDFILAYLAFVQTGADPDDFDDLPVNNQPTLLAGANVWIFSNEGGRVGTATMADVADDGQIRSVSYAASAGSAVTFDYTGAGNALKEHGRVGDAVAWTRYERGATGGVANQNVHLLLGTPAINLPASGTVDYKLVGGTAPTNAMAPAGEIGSFTGDLAVAFGTTPRVGVNFDVHVGTRGWHAQTPGGAAGAASGGLTVGGDMRFQSQDLGRSGIAGNACSGYCIVQVFGGLFGNGAASAGFEYHIDDQSSGGRSYINGTAVFGTTGTELARIGTMPSVGGGAYDGPFDTETARIDINFPVGDGFGVEKYFDTADFTLDADGALTRYVRTSPDLTRTLGTASAVDAFTSEDFAIGRWTNGLTTGSPQFALNANQGAHYLLMRPVAAGFVLPTSGRIDYYLVSATSPTIADGSMAPGTFDGGLALLFGGDLRIAIEGEITMPTASGNFVHTFSSNGGLANADDSFTFLQSGGTPGAFAFTLDDGSVSASGGFAGGGTDGFGLIYSVDLPDRASIGGAAVFEAGAPRTGGTGGTPGGLTGYSGGFDATQPIFHWNLAGRQGIIDMVGGETGRASAYTLASDGTLSAFTGQGGGRTRGIGTAVSSEKLGNADALIQRWHSGTTTGFEGTTLSANQGAHTLLLRPGTVTLPASGRIDYDLLAATKPTIANGSIAPGTFAADLAILFGAAPKVAMEGSITMPATGGDYVYSFATAGGMANAAASVTDLGASSGFFAFNVPATDNATTNACAAGNTNCVLMVNGAFAAGGTDTLGITYQAVRPHPSPFVSGAPTFIG